MLTFPFLEAAYMAKMMSGGDKVIETLQVSKNGVYNASAGVDGYSPVIVGVPDRYEEGYNKGHSDGQQEGYDEGYADGDKDGRKAQKDICDEEKKNLIDEIAELEKKLGFTFPDTTSYDDIYKIIGGAGTITDTTKNEYIDVKITESQTSTSVTVDFHSSNGFTYNLGGGGYGKPTIENVTVDYVYVNSGTGDYDVQISYDITDASGLHRNTVHQTGSRTQLKGFGEAGHSMNVKN